MIRGKKEKKGREDRAAIGAIEDEAFHWNTTNTISNEKKSTAPNEGEDVERDVRQDILLAAPCDEKKTRST